jgi:hypothetical protein
MSFLQTGTASCAHSALPNDMERSIEYFFGEGAAMNFAHFKLKIY